MDLPAKVFCLLFLCLVSCEADDTIYRHGEPSEVRKRIANVPENNFMHACSAGVYGQLYRSTGTLQLLQLRIRVLNNYCFSSAVSFDSLGKAIVATLRHIT